MFVDKLVPLVEVREIDKKFLYATGGAALAIFAAGMILASPSVRRSIGKTNLESSLSTVVPDVEKYLRLRAL